VKTSSDFSYEPCAQRFVLDLASRFPTIPAVTNTVDTDRTLTFSELAEVVLNAASGLEKCVRGGVVVVQGPPDETMVVDLLALLCAGAIIRPVSPSVRCEELSDLARECGAVAIRVPVPSILRDAAVPVIGPVEWVRGEGRPSSQSSNDVAFHFGTSGTSGLPKTAVLTHRAVFTSTRTVSRNLLTILGMEQGDRVVPILPVHHVLGSIVSLLIVLEHAMTLCCSRSANNLPRLLQHYQPELLIGVPMIVEGLWKLSRSARMRDSGADLSTLLGGRIRYVICGAAPLPRAVVSNYAQAGVQLLNGYGMTECGGVVSCQVPTNDDPRGSVGIPAAPEIEVRTVNGELQVRGDILMSGYLIDGGLDRSAVSSGWLSTGDLAELDEQGRIMLTGRSKNIILGPDGNNISPEELELSLRESMIIEDVVVTSEPLGPGGAEVLAATCVSPAEGSAGHVPGLMTVGEVPQVVLETIADFNERSEAHKRIRAVRMAPDDVPRSELGKIIRRRLVWDLPAMSTDESTTCTEEPS